MTLVVVCACFSPPTHFGGAGLSCRDVAVRLAERGHSIEVLCADTRLPGVTDEHGGHEAVVHRDLQLYLRDGEPWSPPVRQRFTIERHNQSTLLRMLGDHHPDLVSV